MADLLPLAGVDPASIETLLDRAFGADRHGRTAYRLRKGSRFIDPLSFAVCDGSVLIAAIQCWPVQIAGSPLVLVGPVAVDPDHQNAGNGRRLMHAMLEAAPKIGEPAMVMIGDPEYYGRFGFSADLTAGWTLPGPWEAHRLLARNGAGRALPTNGMLERADAL
jgi:predicted N-acetyltransferase YhbS